MIRHTSQGWTGNSSLGTHHGNAERRKPRRPVELTEDDFAEFNAGVERARAAAYDGHPCVKCGRHFVTSAGLSAHNRLHREDKA